MKVRAGVIVAVPGRSGRLYARLNPNRLANLRHAHRGFPEIATSCVSNLLKSLPSERMSPRTRSRALPLTTEARVVSRSPYHSCSFHQRTAALDDIELRKWVKSLRRDCSLHSSEPAVSQDQSLKPKRATPGVALSDCKFEVAMSGDGAFIEPIPLPRL